MPSSGVKTCADRKSTRLNSSHTIISYAVFCLKKKEALQDQRLAPVPGGAVGPDPLGAQVWACARGPAPLGDPGHQVAAGGDGAFFFLIDPAPPEISLFPLHHAFPI